MRIWPFRSKGVQVSGSGRGDQGGDAGGVQAALPERRAAPYTDAIVSAIVEAAGGGTVTAAATGALEACAGLVGRCFAAAVVEAPGPVAAAINPSILSLIGRDLIRRGEAAFLVDVDRRGAVALIPAGSWDVRGGPRSADWVYRLDLFGPSGNVTRLVPAGAVLHFRYAIDAARPWLGLGPLQFATETGRLHAQVERMAADEASSTRGYVVPVPEQGADQGDDADESEGAAAKLRADLGRLGGKLTVVETTAGGYGEGRGAAPVQDWVARRLGAAVPAPMVDLRDRTARAVCEACGVPPAVLGEGDATARREALRVLLHATIAPLGRLVATELSAKLEAPVRLGWDRLNAADVQGRARSVDSLVKAGVQTDQALTLAGFER